MQDDPQSKAKSFEIPKRIIWDAWKHVAANNGAAGVDREGVDAYRIRMGENLYTLWNRMSSGSYFLQPVRQVLIPKGDGSKRPLGIPTVNDRVAQMAVKLTLESRFESIFHPSSFGYRPRKNAHQAVRQARRHCWRFDWVLDMDIKSFFDTIDHNLMMRAVAKHVPERWVRLYIQRWLESPVKLEDGTLKESRNGTPQGAVISPLLANLYLHYAFDEWMKRNFSNTPFERYADDIVCHCRSKVEGENLLRDLNIRMAECRLKLHPDKTHLVYCKDRHRRKEFPITRFDFLGFTFHARTVRGRDGGLFSCFCPAVSRKALKRMNVAIRSLNIQRCTSLSLRDQANRLNPMVRGWINYYSVFYPEPLRRFLIRLDLRLGRWLRNKYKRLRGHKRRSWAWLHRCRQEHSKLFVHWGFVFS